MRTNLSLRVLALLATASAFLAASAGGAGAATVVNGDFETGTLSGWSPETAPPGQFKAGSWFAYSGTVSPFPPPEEELEPFEPDTVPPPPAGTYAAITAQGGPGGRLLYQDVALDPYYSHQLSMVIYYVSDGPLVTPSPNTLTPGELEMMLGPIEEGPPSGANQQYRVDVIKPTAPLTTMAPEDILATAFATRTGDPQSLAPTTISADLSPFAGQTVRVRLAEVDNLGVFYAGADSVAIQSTPPSNAFKLKKRKLNKKKGSAKLTLNVPGAGVVTAKKKKKIKPMTLETTEAGTVKIALKPTTAALETLNDKGKLKVKVAVTFTPTGGLAATKKVTVTLKKNP